MKPLAEWLIDENTYTTCILAILKEKWDTEFFDWDPLTINLQLRDEFSIEATETLMDKIGAGTSLFTTNTFFNDFETFNLITNVLNNGVASNQYTILAGLDDCLWGITEARLLLGPIYKEEEFSPDIADYVGQLLSQDGISRKPAVLSFAQLPKDEAAYTDDNLLKDDAMHLAYWQLQEEGKEQLENFNKQMLLELFQQLAELPVKNMDKSYINSHLQKIKASIS